MFENFNNTNYPINLKNYMDHLNNKDKHLYDYQYNTSKYFLDNNHINGLLLYYGTGYGKTLTTIYMSEKYRISNPEYKVIIIANKSLKEGFKKEFIKYYNLIDKSKTINDIEFILEENYTFIAINSPILYKQILKLDNLDDNVPEIFINTLENKLIIIDEAHNFFNSIANNSKNAVSLYDLILKTNKKKLLFLTATPIINNPFELVSCFNMLRTLSNDTNIKLLPENINDFENYFINMDNKKLKNTDILKNRIFGLTSYYGKLYDDSKVKSKFPKQLKTIIENIPMSYKQYIKYQLYRKEEKEQNLSKYTNKNTSERFKGKSNNIQTYRIKTRLVSNFLLPDYCYIINPNTNKIEKDIDLINNNDLLNLELHSPKFKKILENINLDKNKNNLGLLYSNFVNGEGIKLFAKILNLNNYSEYSKITPKSIKLKKIILKIKNMLF